jgi:hypothetical protein
MNRRPAWPAGSPSSSRGNEPAEPSPAAFRIAGRDATRLLVLIQAELLAEHHALVASFRRSRERFLAEILPAAEAELARGLASLPAGSPEEFHRRGQEIALGIARRRLREYAEETSPRAEEDYRRSLRRMRARVIRLADAIHWHAPPLAERLRRILPRPNDSVPPPTGGTVIRPEPLPTQPSQEGRETERRVLRRIHRTLAASLRQSLETGCRSIEGRLGRRLRLSREALARELGGVLRESGAAEPPGLPGHPPAPSE